MKLPFIFYVFLMIYAPTSAVPENVYTIEGSSYTFVCPHRKTSSNNVVWQFTNKSGTVFPVSDGTFIPTNYPARDRIDIVGNHNIGEYNLELSGLQETDEGTYRCGVSINQKEYYLLLLALPENVYAENGSSYMFVCPYRKISTHNVIWYFTNKSELQLPVSDGTYIATENPAYNRTEIVGDHINGEYNLKLSDLQDTDAGVYRCVVSVRPKDYYFELIAPPTSVSIQGKQPFNNRVLGTEGDDLNITCTALGGQPPPEVTLKSDNNTYAVGTQTVEYTFLDIDRIFDLNKLTCEANNTALLNPITEEVNIYLNLKPLIPFFSTDAVAVDGGAPLVVNCTTLGSRPPAEFQWTLGGTDITNSSTSQYPINPTTDTFIVTSTLIYSVSKSQNGKVITCIASNNVSTVQQSKILEVKFPPSDLVLYGVLNKNIIGTEGQSLSINCTAIGGNSEPDMVLNVSSQFITGKQSVQYAIPVLQRNHDKQLVKCQATNEALENPIEETASLYLHLKPLAPSFTDPVTADGGAPLVVNCTSLGSRPLAALIWTLGGIDITNSSTSQYSIDSTTDTFTVTSTLIYSVNKSANGKVIICIAINNVSTVQQSKILEVRFAPDVYVSNETYNQNVSTRTVRSSINGNPSTYVNHKWQHKTLHGVLVREWVKGSSNILTLPATHEDKRYQDGGIYIVTASNGVIGKNGNTIQTGIGYVTINAQPVLSQDNNGSQTQYGMVGETVYLNVFVYSVPKYTTVMWYKGNIVIRQAAKYHISDTSAVVMDVLHGKEVQLDGYKVILTINRLTIEDFSSYVLHLSNGYGQLLIHTVVLESADFPNTPTDFKISSTSDSSAIVNWSPVYKNDLQQNFNIEYRVLGFASWQSTRIADNQSATQTYILRNLKPGTTYEMRMYAANRFGKSSYTDILVFQTNSDITYNACYDLGSACVPVFGVGVSFIVTAILLLVIGCICYRRKFRSKSTETALSVQNSPLQSTCNEESASTSRHQPEDVGQQEEKRKQPAETYESIHLKGIPNVYGVIDDVSEDKESKFSKEQYETLGVRDETDVYE